MTETMTRPAPATVDPSALYRLSVAQYLAMGDAGILTQEDRVELLEGILTRKMTKNPSHMVCGMLISEQFLRLLPPGWCLLMEGALVTQESVPEPDGMVLRGAARGYVARRPEPADSVLVIEIADSTLETDRSVKKRLYARSGVSVYWIVNLQERQVEVHTQPSGEREEPDYHHRQVYVEGEAVPLVLDSVPVALLSVADILP
jgi:Uma2 family endonuclease